jgi:hypothetical protein
MHIRLENAGRGKWIHHPRRLYGIQHHPGPRRNPISHDWR